MWIRDVLLLHPNHSPPLHPSNYSTDSVH
jgi:hypothetical protein